MIIRLGKNFLKPLLIFAVTALITTTSWAQAPVALTIDGGKISVEFDANLNSRIISGINENRITLGEFNPSETMSLENNKSEKFVLQNHSTTEWNDNIGKGKQYLITATSADMKKEVRITSYDDFPTMLFFQVTYTNTGDKDIKLQGWTNNSYAFNAIQRNDDKPLFWSYEPGSYGWSNDVRGLRCLLIIALLDSCKCQMRMEILVF